MIDTVKLRSPGLPENIAEAIERQLRTKSDVDNETGAVNYCFVSGTPSGSYDHRVYVNVFREELVALQRYSNPMKKDVIKRQCAPYVVIEGSAHKALLGHNVFGGPLEPVSSCRWFSAYVGRLLGVLWPDGQLWRVLRIDQAEAFDLGSYEACEDYIHAMSLARYSRRKVHRVSDETVLFPGTTTAFKAYHKGPEFSRHDFARVEHACGKLIAEGLQAKANGILRLESSIKAKKLKADFNGEIPLAGELTTAYLERTHDIEADRVIREGKAEMETVRTADAVAKRIYEVHSPQLAGVLYGTWLNLAANGEKAVRARLSRPTFFRHRKMLEDCGVSWSGTDVMIRKTHIPAGFSPVRKDSRRLTEQAPEVVEQLGPYLTAA